MTKILHRTAKALLDVADVSKYSDDDWIKNPDLTGVTTNDYRFIKINGNSVTTMNNNEITSFISSNVTAIPKLSVKSISSDYTTTDDDSIILVSSSCTVTLSDTTYIGKTYSIKNISSSGYVNIAVQNSKTIDGMAAVQINGKMYSIAVVFDGTNYWII